MRESLGRHRVLYLLIAICLFHTLAHAEVTPSLLDGYTSRIDLRPHIEYLVENDANSPLSLKDLLDSDHPSYAHFSKHEGDNFSFGYTRSAHWFRWKLAVSPDSEGEWWLQIAPTFLDSINLFIPQADGSYREVRLGDHVPQPERPMLSRHFLVPLELTSASDHYYYLRVESTSTLTLSAVLWDPKAYAYSLGIENTFYGLLFGLIFTAMVISLISGLWIRKPFYFAMAGFLFCNGLLHFTLNGYDQLFYEEGSNWSDRMLGFSVFSAGAAGICLCLLFLEPRSVFPNFTRFMWTLTFLSGVGALISLLGAPVPVLSAIAGVGVLVLISILTVLMLRHRFVAALIMLVLFVPGFITLLFQLARNFSLLPLNFWTTHVWALMTIFQVPYIALVVMLHLRAQEQTFLSEQQKARLHRDLFSMVAHELRTPLAVVDSAITNIELQTQQSHPELAPRFRRVNLGLARLNSLIDNALAEDRLLDQAIQLQRQTITLEQLIEQVRELRPVEPPHSLQLSLEEKDVQVRVDPHWLGLAILNLVDNAIKYSPDGGHIQIHLGREGRMVSIQVIDNGIGIPANAADKIFDKFYRADNALNMMGASGMGLGLFLVQTVVTLHGGHLKYRPNPAGGSVFTLYLPHA